MLENFASLNYKYKCLKIFIQSNLENKPQQQISLCMNTFRRFHQVNDQLEFVSQGTSKKYVYIVKENVFDVFQNIHIYLNMKYSVMLQYS